MNHLIKNQIKILGKRHIKDVEFGLLNEKKVLKWYNDNNYSDNKLEMFKNPFNVVDFVSSDGKDIIELKSRNIYHKQYPDLMIGINKLEEADRNCHCHNYYFNFLCKDGLYGWKYEKGKSYNKRFGGRTDRGIDERRLQGFIPTKDLFLITTEINSISKVSNNRYSPPEFFFT